MRSLWHWLGAVLLVVAGCKSTPELKPENQPEDYSLPAEDDPRYNQPYKYTKNPSDPSLAPSRMNSGPGGGPGMGPRGGRGPMGPGAPGAPMY
jgi:hypothetical protein